MDRMSLLLVAAASAYVAPAQAGVLDKWQAHIAEASKRFGVPANWIRAVIMAESGGDVRAVSPKGAMGLMQLMPDTWNDMRAAHGLGADPFDVRANILAGTAYLKALHDRFGYPAVFAAYHAGPARYEDHLRTGKPLPSATRAYIAGLEKALSSTAYTLVNDTNPRVSGASTRPPVASGMRLFFTLSTTGNSAHGDENSASSNDLFVPLSTRKPDGN